MGKSSFLKLLTYPTIWQQYGQDYNQAVVVFIDCQSLEPFKIPDFWYNILVTIKNNFSFLKTSIHTLLEKPEATVDDLVIILRLLNDQGKFLVLLIDNYDVTLRPNSQYTKADIDTFVSQCRTLAQSEEQNISIVVTSSRRLSQIGPELTPDKSPWYNGYLFENLKPFTNQEVNLLLDRSESLLGWKQAIRKIADGNPALLQKACFLLYEELV
ncbi:MAG: ATP-binding protein, partial [Microcystis sp.]